MEEMVTNRGWRYLHVLQPNQYYGGRAFSDDESRTALSEASPYRTSVERGYPVLIAAARSALIGRMQFLDASHVFDHEAAPMYIDNCCHYTLAGNRVLADAIANAVLRGADR